MKLLILADESVNLKIVKILRTQGFEVLAIAELQPSMSDAAVLQLSLDSQALLLTEDRDFGEWVFAHKAPTSGVIYLRYRVKEFVDITAALVKVLSVYHNSLYGKFVVVTVNKVRIRELV